MTDLLEFLTDERHALKSFALPEEARDSNCVAYQLAQARQTLDLAGLRIAPVSTEAQNLYLPCNTAVIELRAGLGQLS
jgi:hypothetical protein